MVQMNYQKELE